MTEREFQRAVVQLARLMGWRVHHTRQPSPSAAGGSRPYKATRGSPTLCCADHLA